MATSQVGAAAAAGSRAGVAGRFPLSEDDMKPWRRNTLTAIGAALLLWYLFVFLMPRGGHPHHQFEMKVRAVLRHLVAAAQYQDPAGIRAEADKVRTVAGPHTRYTLTVEDLGGYFRFTATPAVRDYAAPWWRRVLLLDFDAWHYPVYTVDSGEVVLRADGRVVEDF